MVSLLLMCRHLCSPGIFAIVAILLYPLPQWRLCPLQAGVVALVVMVYLPLSMCGGLCHCHMALLPLLRWRHRRLHGHCCPYCTCIVILIVLTSLPSCPMGIIIVIAPVLLPLLTWRVCAVALVLLPLSRWCCCPWCAGIITLIMQASLPSLCLHCAVDLQASLPLLSWHVLSRRRHGRPRRRQRQHQRNKVNNASMTRAATPAQ